MVMPVAAPCLHIKLYTKSVYLSVFAVRTSAMCFFEHHNVILRTILKEQAWIAPSPVLISHYIKIINS